MIAYNKKIRSENQYIDDRKSYRESIYRQGKQLASAIMHEDVDCIRHWRFTDMKKFIVLVIYDVVDNKTRNHLVKCLERYGVRVQKSAFEALLNRKQYDVMMRRASRIINPVEDSLRVYILDDIINIYTWGIGERKEQDCIIL